MAYFIILIAATLITIITNNTAITTITITDSLANLVILAVSPCNDECYPVTIEFGIIKPLNTCFTLKAITIARQ